MKTLLALLVFFLLSASFIMQTQSVKTTKVLGHTFSVGDTLTLTKGTMPNGDFMSTFVVFTPKPMDKPYHMSMECTNFKFIIEGIELHKSGLNTNTLLLIHFRENTSAWLDAAIAVTQKEIVLKK